MDVLLIEECLDFLEVYYDVIVCVDVVWLDVVINCVIMKWVECVCELVFFFCCEGFFCDYVEDECLLWWLNYVMKCVRFSFFLNWFVEFFFDVWW